MRIFVTTIGGGKFSLDVEPSDTIKQLKEAIRYKKNIPVENQRIIFAGQLLNNTETIGSIEGSPILIVREAAAPRAVAALSPNQIPSNKIRIFKEMLSDHRDKKIIENKIIQYAQSKGITNVNEAIEGYTHQEIQKQVAAAEMSAGSKRKPAKRKPAKRKPAKRKPAKRKPTGKKKVRKIHKGPRGGKYYISKGRKVYI